MRKNTLFTYITYGNPRTTSPLEGGINSQIREVLRRHRGLSEQHQKRAAEWYLALHELTLDDAIALVQPAELPEPEIEPDEPASPELYDTAASAKEGLWARPGWVGRG